MGDRIVMMAVVMGPCRHDNDTGPVMIVTMVVIGHRDPTAH